MLSLADPDLHDLLRTAMRHFGAAQLTEAAALLERSLTVLPEQTYALLLLALVRDRQDDLVAASALYRRALVLQPQDGGAWQRLGRLRQRLGDDPEALHCFTQAVELEPDCGAHCNDLGAVLFRLGEADAALAAFERAALLDPADTTSRCNRAKVLAARHLHVQAAAAFHGVLALTPRSPAEWHDRATACQQTGDLPAAEAACRAGLTTATIPAPIQGTLRLLLADILDGLHRGAEAGNERSTVGRNQGTMTRRCAGPRVEARVLLVGGAGLCNLPSEFLIDRNRFDVTSVHLPQIGEPDPQAQTRLASLPACDVAFNLVGDADAGADFLGPITSMLQRVACPVLNPPALIPPTRRDRLALQLRGVPGLVVPDTIRTGEADLLKPADSMPRPPWLLRPAGTHGGEALVRVAHAGDLAEAVRIMPTEAYYLSAYHDYRSGDGWCRKYRLAFVNGEIHPVHLAIHSEWKVHYWRAAMQDWMQTEEAAFLNNPASVFAAPAMAALHHVARVQGLDYGGIDCGLLPNGSVLLFEANATMLVHTTGVGINQRAGAHRIRDAMSRRILQAAGFAAMTGAVA